MSKDDSPGILPELIALLMLLAMLFGVPLLIFNL